MRNRFDRQLEELHVELIEMGSMCEDVIRKTSKLLQSGDAKVAKEIRKEDSNIDEQERLVESLCLKLLLQQQPVAKDLRKVSAALKMITDMERIADQAVDISELVIKMSRLPYAESVSEISDMADRVQEMVRAAAKSFVERDGELAKAVCRSDDAVDDLFEVIKKKLTGIVHREIEGDDNGEQALDLLMVAKYLEKIGDHASNIAEWVIFMITGEHKKLN
mgnify:CR=1 FL=1